MHRNNSISDQTYIWQKEKEVRQYKRLWARLAGSLSFCLCERRNIMSNNIEKKINSIKSEIKKLENEIKQLEKENVNFYAVIMQSDGVSREYFQIASEAISEAEVKELVQDNYWRYADDYSIGYVPVSKETHQKIGDLVQLKLLQKNIDKCQKQINGFYNLDGMAVFEQQLDRAIKYSERVIELSIVNDDIVFIDFDD